MQVPTRQDQYTVTTKQQSFEKDFPLGWEHYEKWEEATVGERASASHTFTVVAEDTGGCA
jgi:hypothetical protein